MIDALGNSAWEELAKLDVWLNRFIMTKPETIEQRARNDATLDLKNHIKQRIIELTK